MNESQLKAMDRAGETGELTFGLPEPRPFGKATTQGDAPSTAVATGAGVTDEWTHEFWRLVSRWDVSTIGAEAHEAGHALESYVQGLITQPSAALMSAPAESSSGFALVPLEPTDAMTWAGQQARYPTSNSITVIYKAMLAAAPAETPPAAGAIDAREQEVKS